MRSTLTRSRPQRGTPAPSGRPRATLLALVPPTTAGMLRRSTAALLTHPRRPPLAIPAESRLIFRSGSVRAG